MNLNTLIMEDYQGFVDLCKQHKVSKIYGFGSSITENFDPAKSDIDLVVELNIKDPVEYGASLLSLWDGLEEFFNRRVDLLTECSIKNPYLRKSIEATKKLVYDGEGAKAFV